MFKKIFKGIGKFFKRLFNDPLMLISMVVAAVTVVGFAAAMLTIALTAGQTIALAVGLASFAIGLDIKWLQMTILIAAFAINIANAFANFPEFIRSIFGDGTLYTMAKDYAVLGLALYASASIFFLAGAYKSIYEEIPLVSGVALVVGDVIGEIIEGVGDVVGGVIEGGGSALDKIFTGLFGAIARNPLLLLAGAGAALYLFSERKPSETILLSSGEDFINHNDEVFN